MEYPKIQTVWNRDPATKHRTLIPSAWARPEFYHLAELPWMWTEKIDGTNIRVDWEPGRGLRYGGRTDAAQIPTFLLETLMELLPEGQLAKLYPDTSFCLFGEGYGDRIQKAGQSYIPGGNSFVLFDVFCGGVWLEWDNIHDIAEHLGLNVVPVVGTGTLLEAIDLVRAGFPSKFGSAQAEGLVVRPPVDLYNRRGERVIAKVKTKDFTGGER